MINPPTKYSRCPYHKEFFKEFWEDQWHCESCLKEEEQRDRSDQRELKSKDEFENDDYGKQFD